MDDNHLLTVNIEEFDPLLNHKNAAPIIYWERKQTYFHTKFLRVLDTRAVQFTHHEELPIGEELTLLWEETSIPVYPRNIVRNQTFDRKYAAEDATLGPFCRADESNFAIWTPVATRVELNLGGTRYPMNRQEKGVWNLVVQGDWHGTPYHYEAYIHGKNVRINDPYAKGMMANSESAVLIDFSRTEELTANHRKLDDPQDAIIYELHVRDATIHKNSGVMNKGKFLGLTEKNTKTSNGYSTGLSYFKELGITHIQLLPINDFARVNELKPDSSYNWGYDPLYFQVQEGSYSVLPDRPTARINECKRMIQAIHDEGISVIQDVVLNHVFVMEESDFEKLVPGYFFRYHDDGKLSNGTGVGNDFATERKMVRKFILDTIDFWLTEYKIDGFRFDLMGSMDIETMQQIKKRCLEEDRMILLLGEGWDLPTALDRDKKAIPDNNDQLKGIGFFNDYFRDTLKGNLFSTKDVGYTNGNGHYLERMPSLVTGSVLTEYGGRIHEDVNQTINYVECHDNHTLWDRLNLTNSEANSATRKKMHQLATGITLLSQGIPFIHAGQEFFRTKDGVENSYISGDHINQLDWNLREEENENVHYVKKLITLRKQNKVFHLNSKKDIERRLHPLVDNEPIFGFTLLGENKDFAVFINPTAEEMKLNLPSSGKWRVAVTNLPSLRDIENGISGEFSFINGYELIVFEKNR